MSKLGFHVLVGHALAGGYSASPGMNLDVKVVVQGGFRVPNNFTFGIHIYCDWGANYVP